MHYFILAASKNHSKLFEVNGDTVAPHSIEGMPSSMADAWKGMERQEQSMQSHSAGHGHAMTSGQGGAKDVMEQEEDKYMHDLAHSLHTFLHNQHAPLVFFGVEEEYGMFKKFDQSGKLIEEYVHGSPDHLTLEQMKEKADPIVKAYNHRMSVPLIEQYGNLLGTGRTSNDMTTIVGAAMNGKVDLLLVTEGSDVVDTVVQDAMAHTSAHQGRIVYTDAGALPEEAVVAAILRL